VQLLALVVSSTDNLMQQRQPFWLQPGGGKSYAGDIIAGLRERVGNLQSILRSSRPDDLALPHAILSLPGDFRSHLAHNETIGLPSEGLQWDRYVCLWSPNRWP